MVPLLSAVSAVQATSTLQAQTGSIELAPPCDSEIRFDDEDGEDEQLSDERIASLLQEASTRLQQRASGGAAAADVDMLDPDSIRFPKLNPGPLPKPYIHTIGAVSHITTAAISNITIIAAPLPVTPVPAAKKKKDFNAEPTTAGKQWFDMPLTSKDPKTLRDIQLIQMREALDPHRHYKKNILKKVPKYSQIGTIIADHSEFYSSRLTNKERKKSILEEVMSNEDTTNRFKRKRNELAAKSSAGGKEHYRKMKEKRKRK
ncbi:Fcf2-domain-containing protein [Terfezia boudieri ATCC MYA-4762]|uniref:Fcf2-domain-containing protein n=1 Tax=Terfezia boudieri ATCC MYA-4762 TaxID=1051890 RepID=A0A3N4LVX3_9PEZI|nr:Fcf2-domain-containing protein [Terfezia boudieri ATCC MYA-4762]